MPAENTMPGFDLLGDGSGHARRYLDVSDGPRAPAADEDPADFGLAPFEDWMAAALGFFGIEEDDDADDGDSDEMLIVISAEYDDPPWSTRPTGEESDDAA